LSDITLAIVAGILRRRDVNLRASMVSLTALFLFW
jgi:hypothetical protein